MPAEKVVKSTRKQPTKNVSEVKIKMLEDAKKEYVKKKSEK